MSMEAVILDLVEFEGVDVRLRREAELTRCSPLRCLGPYTDDTAMERIEVFRAPPPAPLPCLRTLALFLLRSSPDMPEGYSARVSMPMAPHRRQSSHIHGQHRLLILFFDQI